MPITVSEISKEQLKRLLEADEGHFIDFKSKNVKPTGLAKHISAFANADGGEMYLGFDEDKHTNIRIWNGFDCQESANGHIQYLESLFPLGENYSYSFLKYRGSHGLVLKIDIIKTPDIVYANKDNVYLRRNAQSIPQKTKEEIERLKFNKGIHSFETNLTKGDKENLIRSKVTKSFIKDVIPHTEPAKWLKKQLLIKQNKATVAGVLLFCDEPQTILPKRSNIKIYRYKTSEKEGTRETLAFDPINVEGPIYNQVYDSVKQTLEIIDNLKVLCVQGLSNIQYPKEALHEIITNAVLHRDYSIADDVHIRIFDNRIEVESPGKLPAHITVDNILNERFARNPTIVRVINKFPNPPNKDIGEGLNTAFVSMMRLKLKTPIIYQGENAVIVIIRHEPLATPEEIILQYLRENRKINNSIGRQICFIQSENVMKRVFERLIAHKLIEKIPNLRGKSTAYRLIMDNPVEKYQQLRFTFEKI